MIMYDDDGSDLCLKLSTRASAEAVILGYRAVPDQVSPENHDEVVADDWDVYTDNHGGGDDHGAPEKDSKVKSAKRGRMEENVAWAERVL